VLYQKVRLNVTRQQDITYHQQIRAANSLRFLVAVTLERFRLWFFNFWSACTIHAQNIHKYLC